MLKFLFTSEGRIAYNATNDEYEFIYDVKDYLGNTRVSFKPTAAGNEIMQEDHYYPFGMKMAGLSQVTGSPETKFTYNGKELEDDFNLNWYHYGARYYDPQLGRWQQVDPVDEFHSPYVYVGNNPVMFVDPDGKVTQPAEAANILITAADELETDLDPNYNRLNSGELDSESIRDQRFVEGCMFKVQRHRTTQYGITGNKKYAEDAAVLEEILRTNSGEMISEGAEIISDNFDTLDPGEKAYLI